MFTYWFHIIEWLEVESGSREQHLPGIGYQWQDSVTVTLHHYPLIEILQPRKIKIKRVRDRLMRPAVQSMNNKTKTGNVQFGFEEKSFHVKCTGKIPKELSCVQLNF